MTARRAQVNRRRRNCCHSCCRNYCHCRCRSWTRRRSRANCRFECGECVGGNQAGAQQAGCRQLRRTGNRGVEAAARVELAVAGLAALYRVAVAERHPHCLIEQEECRQARPFRPQAFRLPRPHQAHRQGVVQLAAHGGAFHVRHHAAEVLAAKRLELERRQAQPGMPHRIGGLGRQGARAAALRGAGKEVEQADCGARKKNGIRRDAVVFVAGAAFPVIVEVGRQFLERLGVPRALHDALCVPLVQRCPDHDASLRKDCDKCITTWRACRTRSLSIGNFAGNM
jgi:hypothetical protein